MSVVAGNVAILAVVAGVIAFSPDQSSIKALAASDNTGQFAANPLDHVSSASIAKAVARMSSLPEIVAVTNQADSEATDLSIASTATNVVDKPQVINTTPYTSNKDIKSYTAVAGDSIPTIAAKYGVTTDSIRWSNNTTGDAVAVGTKLMIPPVTGIVYTVKSGDTPVTLAAEYKADQNKITGFNDAENGLQIGSLILIPDGSKAAVIAAKASVVSPNPQATRVIAGSSPAFGGYNGYDFGYCTYWVAKLRAQAGSAVPMNLGNAATWAKRAAAMGLPTGSTPRVGAAVVTKTAGAGHVAYVTGVNDDGTITISEMNHIGFNKTDTRTLVDTGFSYVY